MLYNTLDIIPESRLACNDDEHKVTNTKHATNVTALIIMQCSNKSSLYSVIGPPVHSIRIVNDPIQYNAQYLPPMAAHYLFYEVT